MAYREIYQVSEICTDISTYEQIMEELSIVTWGRLYVCGVFTLCVLKRRLYLLMHIVRYWTARARVWSWGGQL